jgi:hypothetical protein
MISVRANVHNGAGSPESQILKFFYGRGQKPQYYGVLDTMPFCTSCGSPAHDGQQFCENCGNPLGLHSQPPPPPQPQPQLRPAVHAPQPQPSPASGEEVWGVSAATLRKGFLAGSDRYALIFTRSRVILALVTQEMLDSAVRAAHAAAPAEAGGLMSRMKQVVADKVTEMRFFERYLTMPPDQALAENPANKSLDTSNVSSITVRVIQSADDSIHPPPDGFRLDFQTSGGEFVFTIEYNEGIVAYLHDMFGDKVHLPFGYTRGLR